MKRSPDIPCIPDPTCKYWNSTNGCYEDNHHIYKQDDANTQQKKRFSGLYINKIRLCRRMHEQWEAELGWPEYPDTTEMQVQIRRYSGHYGTDRGA